MATMYKYQTKDLDKTVEVTFLIPPNTNLKKSVDIKITKDSISVYDERQAQPIILGKLYDQVKDSSYHKIEVSKDGEMFGEVEISLEKKNRNVFWPLLIVNSNSETYQSQYIDDQSEFLLSILHKGKDPSLAKECLTHAAEKGNENALFDLASHISGVPNWRAGLQTGDLQFEADPAKSMKYFERFLAMYPYHFVATYRLGYLLKNTQPRKSEDLAKAKNYLFQSFQRNAGYPEAALAIAQIYAEENNEKSAVSYYKFAKEGGLSDPKLEELLAKQIKEENERKLEAERIRKKEKEEKKKKEEEEKRKKEEEQQRILELKEAENQTFYAYTFGAVLLVGAVVAGIYMNAKNNK